jgi:hypothetical protein
MPMKGRKWEDIGGFTRWVGDSMYVYLRENSRGFTGWSEGKVSEGRTQVQQIFPGNCRIKSLKDRITKSV